MVRCRLALVVLLAAAPAGAAGLGITLSTTPNGGPYAPRNVGAIWIEDAGGNFVKTIDRWAGVRIGALVAWGQKSGQDSDAVSGATRLDHSMQISVTWDLKNRAGTIVPDGTYTIRMELADSNASSPSQNHEGTFTFVKGPDNQKQNTQANGGFENVVISYSSGAAACGDGVVDPGELCDGNCPNVCVPNANKCIVSTHVGAAATCDAACTMTTITECVSGDGCCATGCTPETDTDCTGNNENGATVDSSVSGGCATGSGAPATSLVVLALVLLPITRTRARRRSR